LKHKTSISNELFQFWLLVMQGNLFDILINFIFVLYNQKCQGKNVPHRISYVFV